MALVQRFGKPDLFLTITCNPWWLEIKNELEPQEAQNRHDLIARVFNLIRAKLEELKNELFKKQIFGVVATYVYVIEHQKRGLPHAHFLIILKRDWKIIAPESFDDIVLAELPNRHENSHLYSTVVKHMMHGPCGTLNPKQFCDETTIGNDLFPRYRRRNNSQIGLTLRVILLQPFFFFFFFHLVIIGKTFFFFF
jgi:ATP-dependent DNA helicase PIF1